MIKSWKIAKKLGRDKSNNIITNKTYRTNSDKFNNIAY